MTHTRARTRWRTASRTNETPRVKEDYDDKEDGGKTIGVEQNDDDDGANEGGLEIKTNVNEMKVDELRAYLIAQGVDRASVRGMKKAALRELASGAGGGARARADGGERATTTTNAATTNAATNAATTTMRMFQETLFNAKVQHAVSGGEEIDDSSRTNFSGAELTFLGTSSGAPSFTRNVSSLALRTQNEIWLFDCGEATQHQLMRSKLKYANITKIFITHMHGDHIFGLPGLICAISGARTSHMKAHGGKVEPLHIIGPPGIRQYVYSTMTWSRSVLGMPLIVTEMRQTARAGGGIPAPHTSVDPRGKIFMGEYWPDNAAEPPPHFKDERSWTELGASGQLPRWTVYRDEHFCVRATPLRHPVPCFGYVIDERDQPGRLDQDKAIALGLPPGREYRLLKEGESVMAPNGVTIHPEDVIGPNRPGRRLVLLGDTCNSSAMLDIARGADVLVHESTFNSAKKSDALFKGHSTATMAGDFAASIKARNLILTHFSNRYAGGFQSDREDINSDDFANTVDEDDCEDMVLPNSDDDLSEGSDAGERMHVDILVQEAIEAKGNNRVVAASDFFSFNVQRREEFDECDRAKGNRESLFAGPPLKIPQTFIAEVEEGPGGDHHHVSGNGGGNSGNGGNGGSSRNHSRASGSSHASTNNRTSPHRYEPNDVERRSSSDRKPRSSSGGRPTPRRSQGDVASAYFPERPLRRAPAPTRVHPDR